MADNCEVRAKSPRRLRSTRCHIGTGQLPPGETVGSYAIPGADVQAGVTFTSKPGIQVSRFGTPAGGALAANYTVPNAQIAPSLGRNRSRIRQTRR